MPITLDGTLGVTTPGVATPDITLAGSAITASANQLNSSSEDVNSENRIINGDFRVWQRAVSATADGYVAADRWRNNASGGTVTQSLQSFALGDTLGANSPVHFLRCTASGQTLTNHYATTSQAIENVRSYAGQTITVLGWARRSSGTGNMCLEAAQYFGTGGSPSAFNTGIATTTVTLGATWAPFAVTMAIPSIATKTIGTSGTDSLTIYFWTSAGSGSDARTNSLGLQTIGVDFWGIHIRQGTWTAADTALYRTRDVGTEVAMCLRYYEICQVVVIPTASTITMPYRVIKRASTALGWVFDAGTGATYLGLGAGIYSFFQNVGHSQIATATVRADAEL